MFFTMLLKMYHENGIDIFSKFFGVPITVLSLFVDATLLLRSYFRQVDHETCILPGPLAYMLDVTVNVVSQLSLQAESCYSSIVLED